MIEACSLSSGSWGNAFFIRTGDRAFLVDTGISCKQILLRLQAVGHTAAEIGGIFITHEHVDHIRGLRVLLKRFPIPVYITRRTYSRSGLALDPSLLRWIGADDRISIGDTVVESRSKSHDAADPCLFTFYYRSRKISIITDVGQPCGNVIDAVRDADIIFLESNHDEEMLKNGPYPYYLKSRISGEMGHLSNRQAASLIRDYASPNLEHVFLAHLSEINNTPEIACQSFQTITAANEYLKGITPILTSRHGVSGLVRCRG
jgi:phosphoribosyl 1,2-cyclic phosphodiesterase